MGGPFFLLSDCGRQPRWELGRHLQDMVRQLPLRGSFIDLDFDPHAAPPARSKLFDDNR
jgi:hypothetical protein